MAETTEQTPDYLKRAAGSFGFMGGLPADSARTMVIDRVGVPFTDPADPKSAHPIRAGIGEVHPSADVPDVERLPDEFPPADYDGKLATAKDWLDLIDATMKQKRAEAKAAKDTAKAAQDAKDAQSATPPTEQPS